LIAGHCNPKTGHCKNQTLPLGIETGQYPNSGAVPRARQVFEKSADQAGFFEHGKNRLVMPAVAVREAPPPTDQPDEKEKNTGNGSGDGSGLHLDPLLIALLKKIPAADKGWPGPSRVRWFRTFAMNVSQTYDSETEPAEMKIELEAAT
jgi:hypothetical protein